MNWRMLVGLALLLVGMAELYPLLAHRDAIKEGASPTYATAGCIVWMAVGVFLIVKGFSKKEE